MVRSAPVRALTLGHVAARIRAAAPNSNDEEGEKNELPKLAAGYMHLHGVWKPSLEAGTYTVSALQTVKVGKNDRENLIHNYISTDLEKKTQPQIFTVVAPQFSLPAESVNAFYPSDGQQDEGRVLPHIVLNDPVYCPSDLYYEGS
jgi:hypothetical protein